MASMSCTTASAGSPPRSRGRQSDGHGHRRRLRITPAFAGKASQHHQTHTSPRDHPRVRGEGSRNRPLSQSKPGSPPRSRGRLTVDHLGGITPAFAGKAPKIMDDPDARNLSRNHRRRDDKNLVVSQHSDSKLLSFVQYFINPDYRTAAGPLVWIYTEAPAYGIQTHISKILKSPFHQLGHIRYAFLIQTYVV